MKLKYSVTLTMEGAFPSGSDSRTVVISEEVYDKIQVMLQ